MELTTNFDFLAERILTRLLQEGSNNFSQLAAYIILREGEKYIFLYNSDELVQFVLRTATMLQGSTGDAESPESLPASFIRDIEYELVGGILKGYLRIVDPSGSAGYGNCNGAWVVTNAATSGKGYGKALYGLGYALSPSGALVSDRYNVSSSAQAAWYKASRHRGRPRMKLDNIRIPETPPLEDDCVIHPDDASYLNYSYEREGWEVGHLRVLQAAHKEAMEEIGPNLARYVYQAFKSSISPFWERYYAG